MNKRVMDAGYYGRKSLPIANQLITVRMETRKQSHLLGLGLYFGRMRKTWRKIKNPHPLGQSFR